MLKIHSFLRKMKDAISDTIWNLIKRYSRNMAIAAYFFTAVVLVLHFGSFSDFNKITIGYAADYDSTQAMSHGAVIHKETKNEETKASDCFLPDNTEYPQITTLNQSLKINIYPLGQLLIEPTETTLEDTAAVMAVVTAEQQQQIAKEELELFSVNEKEKNTTTVAEVKDEAASVLSSDVAVPANLSLVQNKKMIKSLSDDELTVLLRIVEAEATGEDIYGKILVANVVLNRVNADEFPNTVSEVVFQKCGSSYQFSPTKDGRYWSVKITKTTREAVNRALSGEDYSNGALYFFARRLTSQSKASWFDRSLKKVVQYGCHEFYGNK